ncbi:hypothetical protein ACPCSP_34010 [Streptomyces cinereoruber]|uniref:hypothetical protein n=1 Tax=Streptomyces cinereoruber TaxID=67260 RepID=UPI003C2D438F
MRSRWTKIAALAAGLVLWSAQSAVASDTVGWKTVSTNSNWYCGAYVGHSETTVWNSEWMKFKACTVVNNSGGAQAVLVVQNSHPTDGFYMEMGRVVFESQRGGDVWCAPSNLSAGMTRGCYGPTVPVGKCYYPIVPRVELKINGNTDVAYGRTDARTGCDF